MSRRFLPYLLVTPAIFVIAGMVASLIMLATISVQSPAGQAQGVAWFGQYAKLAATPQYRAYIPYSAWLAAVATLLCLILSYPVAYYMERCRPAVRRLILAFLVLVFFSDYGLRMFGLILVFGKNGLVNQIITGLGLSDAPLAMMYNEIGVVIGLTSGGLPFMIFALNSVIARVDRSLLEAATTLGAPPVQRFWRILFPLTMPGVIAGSTIVFLLALNSYITPALLGGGFVEMVANFIYDQAIELFNLPLGAATAVILFFIATVMLVGINLLLDRRAKRFGIG